MNHRGNLVAFLKSKGIYDDFCSALMERRSCSFEHYMHNGCVFMDIINTAITWRNTQQGQTYWSGISREWNSLFLKGEFNFTPGCRSIW